MSIVPGQLYQDVTYTDADGDSVRIQVSGTITDPANQGFTVELGGWATDNSDATQINLVGLTSRNGVQVVVTPNALPSAGPGFNNIYSGGYTNVAFITADPDPAFPGAAPVTQLGGIQLSAAIVNSIKLEDVAIGNITLDPGQAPYIDRINTTNNQQATDSTMYMPVTGLIDLGGINAASIHSLVINGAIGAVTGNPFDTSVTNDFRSVINVSGRIDSVIGLRSNMRAAIRADSIGSVRVGAISGEITTRNPNEPFAINLPSQFKGFINVAGHLDLGFPLSDGALITGQISAGGGISGSDRFSEDDPLYLPDAFVGSLSNSSPTVGIADIEIDGVGSLNLFSASSVGNLSADAFEGDFLVEAGTSIGNVTASSQGIEGHLQAGTNIGTIKAARDILGTMIAGGEIGSITTVRGGLESLSIQAGGNIGPMSLYDGMLGTSIVAGGDLGPITIPVGGMALSYLRARDIGAINVVDGSIETSSFVADRDIGTITTFGSISGFGISDVSVVAGRNVAAINSRAHTGFAIELLKVEAGGIIASISGTSYGEFGGLDGSGIIQSNFVAAEIGPIYGRSVGGTGIESSNIVTRSGSIASITGDGWLDGLLDVIAVAHSNIGPIFGRAIVDGSGIDGGSYDANYGSMGQVTAIGGSTNGYGIVGARFQATDEANGGIAGFNATADANGQDAMGFVTIYASEIGPIIARVDGGLDGNGIADSEIRAFWGPIASIIVDVRSINGMGIRSSEIRSSGLTNLIHVTTLNNTAIHHSTFNARAGFGPISAEAQRGGSAIDRSTFTAADGPIAAGSVIRATARGTDAQSNGIIDSTFLATGGIGRIEATSRGAGGIIRSTFTADSDLDDSGGIEGIEVTASGRQLGASRGIADSTFLGTDIGSIVVTVETVEGGTAIENSTFTARTAVNDGVGDFDNTGRIANILVRNMSGFFNGIQNSTFEAGSAGSIGSIDVVTEGGIAIVDSTFRATANDADQNLFTSTIGAFRITTVRNADATLNPAGIVRSTFESNAGIASITVNSVGTAIEGSTFNADFDFGGLGDIAGDIGSIQVTVPGRNASGIVRSNFTGGSIGSIAVRLADNALTAQDAIQASGFTALRDSIGVISVVNTGIGSAIANSIFVAATSIGNITVVGDVVNTQFIVLNSTIGDITVYGNQNLGMVLQAQYLGNITLLLNQPGSVALVMPTAVQMGSLTVTGSTGGQADLVWQANSLAQAGDLNVSGSVTLLASMLGVSKFGNFNVGGLASASGDLMIGSTSTASTIGPIRVGQPPSGNHIYKFAFGVYGGIPNAIVGGQPINAGDDRSRPVNNVRLILNRSQNVGSALQTGPTGLMGNRGLRFQAQQRALMNSRQRLR